jgi:hypothetical protein
MWPSDYRHHGERLIRVVQGGFSVIGHKGGLLKDLLFYKVMFVNYDYCYAIQVECQMHQWQRKYQDDILKDFSDLMTSLNPIT